jgi:transcriptional regulator with XRE-family HTH domain
MPARLPLHVAFGQVVRELREEQGLSQEELGNRTGLHRNHVGQVERGELTPTLKSVEALADALGLPPSELIARSERVR